MSLRPLGDGLQALVVAPVLGARQMAAADPAIDAVQPHVVGAALQDLTLDQDLGTYNVTGNLGGAANGYGWAVETAGTCG